MRAMMIVVALLLSLTSMTLGLDLDHGLISKLNTHLSDDADSVTLSREELQQLIYVLNDGSTVKQEKESDESRTKPEPEQQMKYKLQETPRPHRKYRSRLNQHHPMVETMWSPRFWEIRDNVLPRGEYLLKGLYLYDYQNTSLPYIWQNTSNCMFALGNFTWITVPSTLRFLLADNPTTWLKYQIVTEAMRELGDDLFVCNDMLKNAHVYITRRITLFSSSLLNWSYGFLQNILGKIMSINNVYKSLTLAIAAEWEERIYLDVGRVIRILLIFDPIELEDPEMDWYINGTITPVSNIRTATLIQDRNDLVGGKTPAAAQHNLEELWQDVLHPLNAKERHLAVKGSHRGHHDVDLSGAVAEVGRALGLDEVTETVRDFLEGIEEQMGYDQEVERERLRRRHPHPNVQSTSAEFQDFTSFEQFYDLVTGFANGTAVLAGPSFANCSTLVNQYSYHIRYAWDIYLVEWHGWIKELYLDRATVWPFLLINDELIWMLYSFYDLSNACWYSGFEVFGGLTNYNSWMNNPQALQSNILNDFGFIYTVFRDLQYFLFRDKRSIIRSIFELGRSLGHLYYFVLISDTFATEITTIAPSQVDPTTGTMVFVSTHSSNGATI